MQYYDIIGDIHGCAEELELLLSKLGYQEVDGVYTHAAGRKVIFLGDFIDRGPGIARVLEIVKKMWEAGQALSVMGNHEYNAVAYATKDTRSGQYLREHSDKNRNQHAETLQAFEGRTDEWQQYINWFKKLPLCLQVDGLNIIHACWDQRLISLHGKKTLDDHEFLLNSAEEGRAEYGAVETLLKGKETLIGEGITIPDKDGDGRENIRTQWWLSEEELEQCESLNDIVMTVTEEGREVLKKVEFKLEDHPGSFCGLAEGLTFVGHYWFKDESAIITPHLACLDFSCVKGGQLCAYRWNGERELEESNIVKLAAMP